MSASLVYQALVEPESFAERFANTATPSTLAALTATASLGVGAYGAAMHAWDGAAAMGIAALSAVVAAGIAWMASMPSLYILGSMSGSKLPMHATVLASLITVSFGGLAMLASIPVLWFFELCAPNTIMRVLINLTVFGGVGMCMMDVFTRVMARLEGRRLAHWLWLGLLSVVGAEMFYVFGLFNL